VLRFLLRRVTGVVPVLIGVTIVAFGIITLIPGDPATAILGPQATGEAVASLRADMGLDRPLHVQYWRWLSDALHGDLGTSIRFGQPVAPLVVDRFVNTLWLAGAALLIATMTGVAAGLVAARRAGSVADRTIMFGSLLGNSMPHFWLGILLIVLFSLRLGWLPAGGMFSIREGPSLSQTLQHLVLPAATLGVIAAGVTARLARSAMVEVLSQDYIRTARSVGVREWVITWKHALKNGSLPIVTIVGAQAGFLLSGAVLTEIVFVWPGLGTLMFESIKQRDFPVVQGGLLLVAVAVTFVNLAVDLIYGLLDPRIQHAAR
jgi:peptide/nickel transport system permease protein